MCGGGHGRQPHDQGPLKRGGLGAGASSGVKAEEGKGGGWREGERKRGRGGGGGAGQGQMAGIECPGECVLRAAGAAGSGSLTVGYLAPH